MADHPDVLMGTFQADERGVEIDVVLHAVSVCLDVRRRDQLLARVELGPDEASGLSAAIERALVYED